MAKMEGKCRFYENWDMYSASDGRAHRGASDEKENCREKRGEITNMIRTEQETRGETADSNDTSKDLSYQTLAQG